LAPTLVVKDEVLYEVEHLPRVARSSDHRFKADDALFFLIVDLFPFREVLPLSCDSAYATLAAVREDDERVMPEGLRYLVLVGAEVVLVGMLKALVGGLEFDEDEGQAVYKANQVGASAVKFSRNPELRGEKKVVVPRVVPIHHPK